ncbi:hypothetical protein M2284_002268 [Rhodococcus sp. LBL1]|nr:hypothetical protein [Rhodococcus sp. LBL1]MDH6683652.1 hypothetical protein [Rhodococcus sp. LBL2]
MEVGEIAAGALACDVVDDVGLDVNDVETAGAAELPCQWKLCSPGRVRP